LTLQAGGGFGLGGGGTVRSFKTVTSRVAVALLPSASVTQTVMVWVMLLPGFIFGSPLKKISVRCFAGAGISMCLGVAGPREGG
jgi:hypothetical protein